MNANVNRSILEVYRPRKYGETYQGVEGWPISELVAQELAHDYSQNLLVTGPMGVGKTTVARIRGARRGCIHYQDDAVEPCGTCIHCVNTFAGYVTRLGAYHEIDCAQAGWRDELERVIAGGVAYTPVEGRKDHDLPRVVTLDELQRTRVDIQQSLLTPLERNPRVQFILCTTDVSAILPELVNRCQHLELKPPTPEQFRQWLTRILTRESITYEDGVIDDFFGGSKGKTRTSLLGIRPMTRTGAHLSRKAVRQHFGLPDLDQGPPAGRW